MSRNKLRKYQIEANEAIVQELTTNNSKKCLVKMFCGTGKSTIMRTCPVTHSVNLLVYVFPSLSLISQFTHDYLKTENPLHILKISSDDNSTTECSVISAFLSQPFNKIICITYQSFATLIDNLNDLIIDVCIFDEAHHAVGQTYQQLIFNDCEHSNKQIFFTATPKNTNGITMYEKDTISNCGKMVYDYSYYRGITEGYLNPFEIRLDFYTEHNNHSIYESICRAILASGNNRVLTFHSDVNTERDTSVNNFVNQLDLDTAFNKILNEEFCEKIGKYSKIKIVGLSSSIVATCPQCLEKIKKMIHRPTSKSCCRYNILEYFDKTKDNEIFIISSCETIGEGIDTKNANMCVFVDPKSSYVSIMQNIGRIVRKNGDRPLSTILIPCWVNKEKYLNCGEDKEKCDEAIREDLGAQGNFNQILNVMSALKQEDEELYNICLHYPDKYSPQEIQTNLEKQGFMMKDAVGEGNLLENVEHLLDEEIDYENYEDLTDEETLMQIASDFGVNVEVHTDSLETPIEKYISSELSDDSDSDSNSDLNSDSVSEEKPKKTIRLYKAINEETEEPMYSPIVEKTRNGGEKKKSLKNINAPDRNKRVNINAHTNPDVKILWNISSDICGLKDVCSCVVDCEIVDNWYERLEELKRFIDENERRPSSTIKNKYEKSLGHWITAQTQNYKNVKYSMKNQEKYNLWKKFSEDYKKYFMSNYEIWHRKFKELKDFIDENERKPSNSSTNKCELQMARWIGTQNKNYEFTKWIMLNVEIYDLWTNFLKQYESHFKSSDEIWNEKLEELKQFIDNNERRPSQHSKNEKEKILGEWLVKQTMNCKNKTKSMENVDRLNLWENFMKQYEKYFKSNDEIWYENLEEVEKFISKNKRRPTSHSNDEHEEYLRRWMQVHKSNYETKTQSMKDAKKCKSWENFVENYEEYLKSNDEIWYETFDDLKKYISENKKRPIKESKNLFERRLGSWLSNQLTHYKTKKCAMKDENKYNLWTQFIENNVELFKSSDDIWYEKFEKLKQFIHDNQKRPRQDNGSKNERELGIWQNTQNGNYENGKCGMKDEIKCNLWTQFLEKNATLFKSIDDIWYENFEKSKIFININRKRPSSNSKNDEEKCLGRWIQSQNTNYRNKKDGMKDENKYNLWTDFLKNNVNLFKSSDDIWHEKFEELKQFIGKNCKKPKAKSLDKNEKYLSEWIGHQNKNYETKKNSMKDPKKYILWTKFLTDYRDILNLKNDIVDNSITIDDTHDLKEEPIENNLPTINDDELFDLIISSDEEDEPIIVVKKSSKLQRQKVWKKNGEKNDKKDNEELTDTQQPPTNTETNTTKRTECELTQYHRKYITMRSDTLANHFRTNRDEFTEYHTIRDKNLEKYDKSVRPHEKIIAELERIKTKRQKLVVDMGCGMAKIAGHFANDLRFNFINYDHISSRENITECDISQMPLEDDSVEICIMSMALWGSNCNEYIAEANRVLESGGKLYIIDSTKRWSDANENTGIIEEGTEGDKLKHLLVEKGFQIINCKIDKWCMFICEKV